jgi:DNA-binding GntR family transcriptional regulator
MVIANTQPRAQLKDEAAAHIRELIISGQVAPGQLIRLAPLAERVGASVTPVREALLLLAQDGWVVQEPNRGFRVASITRRDVYDAYFVHSSVAGELAARAARAMGPATVDELLALDAAIKSRVDGDDVALEEVNYRLHQTIYAVAESPRLVWFISASARFVPRRFWGTIPGWFEHNRDGHEAVIRAVAEQDAEAASSEMKAHIDAACELLVDHLETIGFWSPSDSEQ